jgi:hypothetical protein
MIDRRQTAGAVTRYARRFRCLVLVELPSLQLLVIAAAIGVLWAMSLFEASFVAGRHAFWRFPQGTIGYSENDMAQVLVAYFYYVQSPWQLPLFYVESLGAPFGANVVFMDVVPIVALIGKTIHSLTGAILNLYGAFLFFCFVLPGVMMTLVLIAANVRYALGAVIAAIFADTTPALLWRWGHIALEAQFLLIGALWLYLVSLKPRAGRWIEAAWIAYLICAYLTEIYLFVMIGTVWACSVIQRRLAGLIETRQALVNVALTVTLVTIVIALSGQFGAGIPLARYGHSSMNLLSPFVPQRSGLLRWVGGVIDATGGQYEGFNYLGLGLLLASVGVLSAEAVWLAHHLRRHAALFAALVIFAAFAVSHRVFAGDRLLFELPLPIYVNAVLGIFRSSGRFFWLIVYAQMAIVIVLCFRPAKPAIVLCLLGAAILQLGDVQPLRKQIIDSISAGPAKEQFDQGELAELVARARRVETVPSYQCSMSLQVRRANMELMLATARANVPINSVYSAREGLTLSEILHAPSRPYAARREAQCAQEIAQAEDAARRGDILLLLSDQPRPEEMAPGVTCRPLSAARICERDSGWNKRDEGRGINLKQG